MSQKAIHFSRIETIPALSQGKKKEIVLDSERGNWSVSLTFIQMEFTLFWKWTPSEWDHGNIPLKTPFIYGKTFFLPQNSKKTGNGQ